MINKIDLHTHTNYSDGDLSPAALIKLVKKHKINTLSITDHDSIGALLELQKSSEPLDIEIISGIELSTTTNRTEVHLLGYLFDTNSLILNQTLKEIKEKRLTRAKKIIKKLNNLDINIDIEQVVEIAGQSAVCRPHIAHTLVKIGVVKNFYDAFKKYLRDDGPADEQKENISTIKAINIIHEAKGIAFLAHPVLLKDELLKELATMLDGIEVIHPLQNKNTTKKYLKFCNQYGLLESGGSDFHSIYRGDLKNLGKFTISVSKFNRIKKYWEENYSQ